MKTRESWKEGNDENVQDENVQDWSTVIMKHCLMQLCNNCVIV